LGCVNLVLDLDLLQILSALLAILVVIYAVARKISDMESLITRFKSLEDTTQKMAATVEKMKIFEELLTKYGEDQVNKLFSNGTQIEVLITKFKADGAKFSQERYRDVEGKQEKGK
jgi:hypothetical protein